MTKPRYLATIKDKGFWFIEGRTVYFLPWLYGTVFGNMFGVLLKLPNFVKVKLELSKK